MNYKLLFELEQEAHKLTKIKHRKVAESICEDLDILREYRKEDEYILFEVNEQIIQNECIGDQIGLCENDNVLWVYEDIDLKQDEVVEFIENYFTSPIKTINILNQKFRRMIR